MQRTCSSPSALPDPGGIGHATVLHADRQDDTSPPPKQHVKNALCGSCRRGRFSYGGSCALWGVWHISLPLRGRRRAQRGRMRSRQGPNEVASMQPSEPAVSNAGGLRRLLGNSLGFRETLGCRDIPAQGLTPPLHPRKGHHPLTLFRWRDPWGWPNLRPLTRFRWGAPVGGLLDNPTGLVYNHGQMQQKPEADDHEALCPHWRTSGAQHVRSHS